MLFVLGGFDCDLFTREYFIQRLVNNTGEPLSWIFILSPDIFTFLENYIKGLPVTGGIKT